MVETRNVNIYRIIRYLNEHPDMLDVVQRFLEVFMVCFVEDELTLELYNDMESDDEYLTLCIRQEVYEDDIMKKIEECAKKFDDELSDKSGWILVTTDFQPPKRQ